MKLNKCSHCYTARQVC